MNPDGRRAAPGWWPSREMLADFGCVLAAWAAAYLLRLGLERIYVVTIVPEVLFILACATATVVFLKLRGQYFAYRTRFHRGDARRILVAALGIGFGFSALARFFDIEIISRTAIVLAPPLSAIFMMNWRLVLDHFGAASEQPARSNVGAARRRKTMVVVNLSGLDLAPIYRYLKDPEANFDLLVFGPFESSEESQPEGKPSFKPVGDLEAAFAQVGQMPEAVIALPLDGLAAWQADSRYRAQPGHRFVSIESLLMRVREEAAPLV